MPVTRKVVILGDSMVGKSNLAIRFARDEWAADTAPNFGAAFFEKGPWPHAGTPGGSIKWEVFDTSGQDRYRGMNAMYYTTAAAAIVAYDITDMDSYRAAKSWINELQRRGPRSLVIALVGTKKDLDGDARRVPLDLLEEFASQPIILMETAANMADAAENCVAAVFEMLATRIADNERAEGEVPTIERGAGDGGEGGFVGRVTGAVAKMVTSPRKGGGGGGGGGGGAGVDDASSSSSAAAAAAAAADSDAASAADVSAEAAAAAGEGQGGGGGGGGEDEGGEAAEGGGGGGGERPGLALVDKRLAAVKGAGGSPRAGGGGGGGVGDSAAAPPPRSPYQRVLAWFGAGGEEGAAAEDEAARKDDRVPRQLACCEPVVRVSAGGYHSLAVTEAGRLFSCGFGDSGQLGMGRAGAGAAQGAMARVTLGGLGQEEVVDAAAGGFHSLVLTSKGRVWSFGFGRCGQLGLGDREDVDTPTELAAGLLEDKGEGGTAIATISAGHWHSLLTTEGGALLAFGCSDHGRLGVAPKKPDRTVPTHVTALQPHFIVGAAAGGEHSLAVTRSGAVFSWGRGRYGQLGHGDMTTHETPTEVAGAAEKRVTNVSAGFHHSLLLTESGMSIAFGRGDNGRAGLGDELKQVRYQGSLITYQPTPQLVALPWEKKGIALIGIAAGSAHSLLLGSDGTLLTFGDAKHGALGIGEEGTQLMPATVDWLDDETMVVHMACGLAHSLAVTSEGHVFRFGVVYDEATRKLEKVAPVPEYHYDDELAELFS